MKEEVLWQKNLTSKEKAYLLDKLGNCSFYLEKFGELDEKTEKELIVSIFLKIQN